MSKLDPAKRFRVIRRLVYLAYRREMARKWRRIYGDNIRAWSQLPQASKEFLRRCKEIERRGGLRASLQNNIARFPKLFEYWDKVFEDKLGPCLSGLELYEICEAGKLSYNDWRVRFCMRAVSAKKDPYEVLPRHRLARTDRAGYPVSMCREICHKLKRPEESAMEVFEEIWGDWLDV